MQVDRVLDLFFNNNQTTVDTYSSWISVTKSRYTTIELEVLAVAWAIQKCKLFLSGLQHFCLLTDHNPLVPILYSRRLDEIENPSLQDWSLA